MKREKQSSPKLLQEFPPNTAEQWRLAAEQLLKGAPFEKVMTRQTPEGIRIEPIFRQDVLAGLPATETFPGFDGFLRGTSASGYTVEPWEIAQELPYGEPAEFNRAALGDLMAGQNALNIILDIATLKGLDPADAGIGEVCGCGLSLANLRDVQTAFAGILPDAISFHIRSGWAGLTVGGLFFSWLADSDIDPKGVKGSLGMDPLAVQAASGKLPLALEALYDEMAAIARHCCQAAPQMRAVGVSGVPYHQAGASSVQELGIALATGTAYLDALIERGMAVDDAARQIRFSFAVGPNFFMEIAKLRAARMLWAQVVKGFGGGSEAQKIQMHARTGFFNKTRKDPYVNMLRTTSEALSAAIAGIDSLCVGNFDEVCRMPDNFSRRISRNTHIILQEECELTHVVDPAGGSWAVEWLTNEVAEKSWAFFQEIEKAGGQAEALKSGFIRDAIIKTAAGQASQLNQRRVSLVGTNVYPNTTEKALPSEAADYRELRARRAEAVKLARDAIEDSGNSMIQEALARLADADDSKKVTALQEAFQLGASLGEVTRTLRGQSAGEPAIEPLPNTRLAAKYEAMRDASAAFAAEHGQAPIIFLCNLGPLRRHKARADFTKSFFEAGGFHVISPTGFQSPDEALEMLHKTPAGVVVVCGTDDDYAEHFGHYAKAIKASDPDVRLVLAGFPGEREAQFRADGMDDYIFVKSDNYAVNHKYLSGLGVL